MRDYLSEIIVFCALYNLTRRMSRLAITVFVCFLSLLSLWAMAQQEALPIKSIKVNGKDKTLVHSHTIELKALEDDLIIEFAPKDSVKYEYQLKPYQSYWVSSSYPVVSYTKLSGDNYVLQVRTLKNGKTTVYQPITIAVEKAVTEVSWFWPAVVIYAILLISAGAYFFLLYNFRQKLKVESIRNRIAADLHDEVGATLSSIAIATRLVERKLNNTSADLLPILQQIKTDSEDTIQTIRDTVWTINPHNDSLAQLFEKMRSFALQILTAQDIALDFNNQISSPKPVKISMEQRRNVYLIFKEAINNIAKHAQATHAKVGIKQEAEGIRLEISDNGVGFDTAQVHEGNGLKNFKKRAEESFIQLELHSSAEKGTQLSMLVYEV